MWALFSAGFGVGYDQERRTREKAEAGRLMIRLASELRQASSVTAAQAATFTFAADLDKDGADESIQYTWSGASGQPLNRVVGTTTTPMINTVSSLAFTYYDGNNNQLSFPVTASQVKLVLIDLTTTDGDEIFNLRNRIRLISL